MSFIWPAMLLLVLAIPLGVAGYVALERRRARRMTAYGSFVTGAGPSGGAGGARGGGVRATGWRRRIPAACMLVGLTILVVALARPQSVVSVPRVEGTVILAFDVSGSMAADDLEPTRMEAAKTAARTFVERQPASVLIGVVAFSDSGFSVQVPTNDPVLVLAAIDRLAPERGTSLGRGIVSSLATIEAANADPAAGFYSDRSPEPTPDPTPVPDGTYAPAVIVLLTDGENNQSPNPLEAAQAAADRGVRVHTIGVGSAEGTLIEVEGFRVHSRLDEPLLRQIATMTEGTYHAAADPAQLQAVYDSINPRLVIKPEAMEVTSLFAGAAVLILLAGAVTSLVLLGRMP